MSYPRPCPLCENEYSVIRSHLRAVHKTTITDLEQKGLPSDWAGRKAGFFREILERN